MIADNEPTKLTAGAARERAADSKGTPVVLLTYNVLNGGRGREEELYDIIGAQDADVILLQEVADAEFVTRLAERMRYNFFVAKSNSWLTVALLARLPIRNASGFHPRILRHTCLCATVEYAPGKTLKLYGIHLAAPAYTLPVEMYRLRELNSILDHIREARAERIILAGDLNSIAPGDAVDLSGVPLKVRAAVVLQGGLIARQVVRKLTKNRFTDCYRSLHPGTNGFTLPPAPPRVRLDYFFVNDALAPHLRACEVVETPREVRHASDHLPVRMELEL
jgi:exonuclease III